MNFLIDPELLQTTAIFAAAVSADAVVLTICDFESNGRFRRALRWAVWVTLAHWAFAALGLSGLWALRLGLPALAPVLQVATALLLCVLLVQILMQSWRGVDAGHAEGRLGFAAKVWIVSIDALFVGAGESAMTAGWASGEIFVGLAILGPMIGVWLWIAVGIARWIGRLVGERRLEADSVLRGGAIGGPALALPIFSYLIAHTIRGIPPI